MTKEELGLLFPCNSGPSTRWNACYHNEKHLIKNSFTQSEIVNIDHIGSTAIPGLKAKPMIDILLQISKQVDNQK